MIIMIHGRFQPFHAGHMQYLLDALALGPKVLIVGVTNPGGRGVAHASDDHRHLSKSNPYSYVDRALMVDRSARTTVEGLGATLLVHPFDLDHAESWNALPMSTIQFVSAIEPWDHEKAERFRRFGFPVQIYSPTRITSGSEVRQTLNAGGELGELVPEGTRRTLSNLLTGT